MSDTLLPSSEAAAFDAVRQVLAQVLCVTDPQYTRDQSLLEDLEMDSLELIEMAMQLEERWGIELDADQFRKLATVGDVAALIQRTASSVV